jgi:RNase P/RNase MRP subunit p29
MIKYTKTNWTTGASEEVVEHVNSTFAVNYESIQVMSDIWEFAQMSYSIGDDGSVVKKVIDSEFKIDCDEYALARHYEYKKNLYIKTNTERAEILAAAPAKGKLATIVRGRDKSVIGIAGTIITVIERQYGNFYRAPMRDKIAIALDDEMVEVTMPNGKKFLNHKNVIWVWAHNCDIVPSFVDTAVIEAEAHQQAFTACQAIRKQIEQHNKKAA